ncbi:hypothetical protein Gpo141_00010183 [Globisporangium polare]
MDEYRQSLAGRALADVLQELESSGTIDAQAGDTLFDLFDAAVREEFLQAKQQSDAPVAGEGETGDEEQQTPRPFTHTSLELRAGVESYNRFMDKWSVVAVLAGSDNSALLLDKARLPLPPAASRMLIKLHRPPPATDHERHAPQLTSKNQ